jgi:gliding motility-associated-like protein
MMLKKLSTLVLLFGLISLRGYSQTPTSCFEIESILVDACGTPEGENEMVRFIVGPTALNTADLSITWPSNPYRGICQNATTASKVASINSTILGCGSLVEPTGGVLPAGAKVLLITSENFNTTAHSFANLNETLYVIFQCAGNTTGHFANYSSPSGIRTLTMTFSNPSGCTDQVSYDKVLLVNQSGNPGAQDGGYVNFDWSGNATYANAGCQAPFVPLTVTAGSPITACYGDVINLNGAITGDYTSAQWSGGAGTFINQGNPSAQYTISATDASPLTLTLTVTSPCGSTIQSTVNVTINSAPIASITASGPTTFCSGSSVTLTAAGGFSFSWSTGGNTSSIVVTQSGTYSVTATNSCGSDVASQVITVNQSPVVNIAASGPLSFCNGGSVTLTASGASSFVWSTGDVTPSITVSASATYTVTGDNNNGCGTSTSSVLVQSLTSPTVSITPSGPTTICAGGSVTLTASGASTYLWSDGSNTAVDFITQSGTYTVTGTNSCGTDQESITITSEPFPVAGVSGNLVICGGNQTTLTASGGSSYSWSNGSTASTASFTNPGNYFVTVTNACGSDTKFFTISEDPLNAAFTASPLTGMVPLTALFANTSSNAVSYSWNFGDGSTSTETNPTHTYLISGSVSVILTATNSSGCIDTAMVTLEITKPESFIEVPNVFTPNGSGPAENEIMKVRSKAIRDFSMKIFDRWGILITELTTPENGWDGTTKAGKQASDGTYFYVLTATGYDEVSYLKKGSFTLLR